MRQPARGQLTNADKSLTEEACRTGLRRLVYCPTNSFTKEDASLMIRRCTERIMARIGRPPERALTLSDGERDELERIGRSRSVRHSLGRRAQIVLASVRAS